MQELKIINEQKVLDKDFKMYGTYQEPLFLAKEVANWIEHSNPTEMVRSVDDDEKLNSTILSSGQMREVTFLTENGLYEVLMQSRKPIAKMFKKEVKRILKQIRQTGGYIPISQDDDEKMILSKAVLICQKTIEQKNNIIATQNQQLTEQQPLVEYATQIVKSKDSIDMNDFAKIISKNGIMIGRNTLFRYLRYKKILMEDNTPYQRYISNGWFEVVISKTFPKIITTTYVRGKGNKGLCELIKSDYAIISDNYIIGSRLSEFCSESGLTIKHLANISEIDEYVLTSISEEDDLNDNEIYFMMQVAKALKIPVNFLLKSFKKEQN